MKTRRFKRIRWLLLLSLYPFVSHATNDPFANLCEGTGAFCPKVPETEQEITDLMIEITQQWLQAAVEQEIQAQTPTGDTGSGNPANPEPSGETTETPTDSNTTGSSSNPIPNPMPAPPPTQPTPLPIVKQPPQDQVPAVEKPVEQPKVSDNSSPQQPPSTDTPVAPTQPTDNKTEDKIPESNIEVSPPATTPDPVKPPVAPTPTEPTQTVTEDTTEITPSTVPVDNKDTCPLTSTLHVNCRADNQIFNNITIATGVSISQIQLRGQIVNNGMISNSTLLANSTLTGGKISGEFENFGTMQDIQFVGNRLNGGTLAGEIISRGELHNVHLAANAHIQGHSATPATLSGTIQGDPQQPALLEQVKIANGAHVSGVKFGAGVTLEPRAIVDLPEFNQSHQADKTGIVLDTTTKFSGGLSLGEPMNFVKALTITPDQTVKLRFNITPEVGHVGQRAQVLFVVGTEKLDASGACSAGTNVSYKVLLRLEQREVDLYAQPNIWIPQLVEQHDEDRLSETQIVFSYDDLWQSKQLSAATCHYFFVGYRLAQDNRIVFDTTPLLLKVK